MSVVPSSFCIIALCPAPYNIYLQLKNQPFMFQTTLYRAGGVLLVVGAVLPLFAPAVAPYVFAAGALSFCYVQMTDRYEGSNLIIRRLRRQQMLGALLLLVTAALMFTSLYGIPPFRGSEWKVTLMIAAVLELYSIFRIDCEEKREQR